MQSERVTREDEEESRGPLLARTIGQPSKWVDKVEEIGPNVLPVRAESAKQLEALRSTALRVLQGISHILIALNVLASGDVAKSRALTPFDLRRCKAGVMASLKFLVILPPGPANAPPNANLYALSCSIAVNVLLSAGRLCRVWN
jgi:hypothetical protein